VWSRTRTREERGLARNVRAPFINHWELEGRGDLAETSQDSLSLRGSDYGQKGGGENFLISRESRRQREEEGGLAGIRCSQRALAGGFYLFPKILTLQLLDLARKERGKKEVPWREICGVTYLRGLATNS